MAVVMRAFRFKRKLGFRDCYSAMVLAYGASFRRKKIDPRFEERIMLAVTEVNGCEVCSYAHTRAALKKGFSKEEIESLLRRSPAYVRAEEAQAILFAQHYADSKGRPDREAYETVVQEYGPETSKDIVAAIQIVMMGNMIGLPLSALMSRLRGKPYANSTLLYELGMQISTFIVFPVSLFHALLRWVGRRESIRFAEAE